MTSLSLFSGAGGLDLGLERAGFVPSLCVEINATARLTLTKNRRDWRLAEPGDVERLSPEDALEQAGVRPKELDLLVGGPPCQPFSKSSYWHRGDSRRLEDSRSNTLRAYLKLAEHALPRVLLLENVIGLGYNGKDEGLRLLESAVAQINRKRKTSYRPQVLCINAADFGVPQRRERLFLIAHRDGKRFEPPNRTHGPTSPTGQPHRTAWDSIGDLDTEVWPEELHASGAWADLLPSIPEGHNYLWHTPRAGGLPLFGWRTRYWSFLLKLAKHQPAWTIQAEPGPATGPFHWRSRKLSVRELCRLQTFPDGYAIEGSYREAYRQIGNAVPPALGELLGLAIRRQFFGHRTRRSLSLIPERCDRCPPPEAPKPVPRAYRRLLGNHRAHPGTGMGPGALRRAR